MIHRGTARIAFGKPLIDLGGNRERVPEARLAITSGAPADPGTELYAA